MIVNALFQEPIGFSRWPNDLAKKYGTHSATGAIRKFNDGTD
jgi:hypothetical protein